MTDRCEHCGGELKRTFSATGIVFKGSGFYVTDSRKPSTTGSSTKKSDSGTSESKSETSSDAAKTETKSDSAKTETTKSDTAA
jgi:predicted nucleic acid-binding Zn ribbon protein